MDTYFLTDKGRAEDRKSLPSITPENLYGYHFDRAILRGFTWGGGDPTSLEDIVGEVLALGEVPYRDYLGRKGTLKPTERDIRASLRRLYEAGLVDRIEQ